MSRARQPSAPRVLLLTAIALGACGPQESSEPGSGDAAAAAPAPPAAAAPAPDAGGGSITPEEIRTHRLSLDRIRAIYQAERNWKRAGGTDLDSDAPQDENATAADGANEMVRQFQQHPQFVSALQGVGLTPREAAVEFMVFAMASIAAAGGGETYTSQVSPESVEFVRANRAELERLENEKEAAAEQSPE